MTIPIQPFLYRSAAGPQPNTRMLTIEFSGEPAEGPWFEGRWVDANANGVMDVGDRIGFITYAFCAEGQQRPHQLFDYQMRAVTPADVAQFGSSLRLAVHAWDARMARFRSDAPTQLSCEHLHWGVSASFDWGHGFWALDDFVTGEIRYLRRIPTPPFTRVESIVDASSPDYGLIRSAIEACAKLLPPQLISPDAPRAPFGRATPRALPIPPTPQRQR